MPTRNKKGYFIPSKTTDGTRDIIEAGCRCPAGAKPSGSCKHISALSYAIEEFCSPRDTGTQILHVTFARVEPTTKTPP